MCSKLRAQSLPTASGRNAQDACQPEIIDHTRKKIIRQRRHGDQFNPYTVALHQLGPLLHLNSSWTLHAFMFFVPILGYDMVTGRSRGNTHKCKEGERQHRRARRHDHDRLRELRNRVGIDEAIQRWAQDLRPMYRKPNHTGSSR